MDDILLRNVEIYNMLKMSLRRYINEVAILADKYILLIGTHKVYPNRYWKCYTEQ